MLKHLFQSQTLKLLPKNHKSVIQNSHLNICRETHFSNPAIDFVLDEFKERHSSNSVSNPRQHASKTADKVEPRLRGIQISHQWPEWVELMLKLMKNGYFDGVGNPFRSGRLIDGKGCNQIRTACLNFARDRPNLVRYFASRDVEMISGSGCPSIDRKVVNSGKRLRAHMGLDEGNVCSSCVLRGNCERAYMRTRGNECGYTVDVMRFVLTYSLDLISVSRDVEPSINKTVEEAVRSLIRDMVKFSKDELEFSPSKRVPLVQKSRTRCQEHQSCESNNPTTEGDWHCPKFKFLNFDSNVKCMRCNGRVKRSQNNWDRVQLKRGDWLCIRCNFLNFAKNTRCLQCHMNPPKRQLNPGEWECDSCNYINFKRNMVCLKCDHKRPKAFSSLRSSVQPDINYGTPVGWIDREMNLITNEFRDQDDT